MRTRLFASAVGISSAALALAALLHGQTSSGLYILYLTLTTIAAVSLVTAMVAVITFLWGVYRRRRLEIRISGIEVGFDSDAAAGTREIPIEERRLVEYRSVQRDEAEKELARYLPANPRRAKRLINHQRLYALIAEDRNVFGGEPNLTHHHLAKWVLIVEHWPRLGAALTRDPSRMTDLEQSSDVSQLQVTIDDLAPGTRDAEELLQVLRTGALLSPILGRLVRFEASSPASEENSVPLHHA